MTTSTMEKRSATAAGHAGRSERVDRLRQAAEPVLDELVTHLRNSSLCVALADHDSVIIETRVTGERAASFDQVGTVPHGTFTEPTPIPVTTGQADERMSCYVQSIQHPLTGEVAGSLIVSGAMPQANLLFMPYLGYAVKDIAQRLLDGSHEEALVLAHFQEAARDRSRAVVVLCEELLLTTPAAAELLLPGDHSRLRRLVGDVPADRSLTRTLELTSGQAADVEAVRVAGTRGVLFRLVGRSRRGTPGFCAQHQLRRLRGTHTPVAISGEPGTGRTHAVRVLAGRSPVATLDASDVPAMGEGAWARRLHDLATENDGVIAIEEIQLLPPTLCVRLSAMLASPSTRFVLTCTPYDALPKHVADLASTCMHRIELSPLRRRRDELPDLVRAMLRHERRSDAVQVAPSTLAALAANDWPGNLRELAMVVRHTATSRTTGEITVADLPEAYRTPAPTRPLTPWQQAERDAIVSALRATAGNKMQAAGRLGISRTTLYNRIRALGITLPAL